MHRLTALYKKLDIMVCIGPTSAKGKSFMNTKLGIATLVIIFSVGCASRPDAIAPVSVSALEYASLTCEETKQTLLVERAKLSAVSKDQNMTANTDLLGVLMLGLPVGKILGADVEGEVALSKGKVQALERAISLNCQDKEK